MMMAEPKGGALIELWAAWSVTHLHCRICATPGDQPDTSDYGLAGRSLKARTLRAAAFMSLAAEGSSVNAAARAVGLAGGTVRSWCSRDPFFSAKLRRILEGPSLAEDADWSIEDILPRLSRLATLPGIEHEIARLRRGEIPSDWFLTAATKHCVRASEAPQWPTLVQHQ